MEAFGRLAAGLAHDFNNHLTVIGSSLELLKRRLDPAHGPQIRHADDALEGVARASALTERMLSLTRPLAGNPEVIDAGRLLTGLSELLGRVFGPAAVLNIRVPAETCFVRARYDQLADALLSLAIAVHEALPAGGALVMAADPVHAGDDRTGVPPGAYVRITITGPFQPYAVDRWHAAVDMAGTGLSMTRLAVQDAGGYLQTAGQDARPSAFRVFLPRHTPPSARAAVPRPVVWTRPRIMVVEADPAARRHSAGTLRGFGYEVLEAPDAVEAFRLIADHGGIDVLFTDVGAPGAVSGRALAAAVQGVHPRVRVLFSVGGPNPSGPPDSGEAIILEKPFDNDQLVTAVRQVLAAPVAVVSAETVQA
jgi:CheY-like chemotaxis protein